MPSSPHLSPKEGSTWTSSTSTGTEIWENNIRHHIKNSSDKPQNQMREPWGHIPSTHIGGTWGEEEVDDDFDEGVNLPPDIDYYSVRNKNNTSVWGGNSMDTKSWGNQNSSINPPTWGSDTCEYLNLHNFFPLESLIIICSVCSL